jgi:hypothetical protein
MASNSLNKLVKFLLTHIGELLALIKEMNYL